MLLWDQKSDPLTRDPVQRGGEFDENPTEVGSQIHRSWEAFLWKDAPGAGVLQPCDPFAEKDVAPALAPAKDAGTVLSDRYLECCKDFLPWRGQQMVFMQCPRGCCYDILALNTGLDV